MAIHHIASGGHDDSDQLIKLHLLTQRAWFPSVPHYYAYTRHVLGMIFGLVFLFLVRLFLPSRMSSRAASESKSSDATSSKIEKVLNGHEIQLHVVCL